jgi:hypothetical protein
VGLQRSGETRRTGRHRSGAVFVAIILGIGSRAWSQGSPPQTPANFKFVWQAPASCPSESQVFEQIRNMVGQDTKHLRTGVNVHAKVRHLGDGQWQLILNDRVGHGQRKLNAASCDALARFTTVFVSLMLDPTRASTVRKNTGFSATSSSSAMVPVPTSSVPVPIPPAASSAVPVASEATSASAVSKTQEVEPPNATHSRSPSLWVGLGGHLQAGMTPEVAVGPQLGVGVVWNRLLVYLFGFTLFPQSHTVRDEKGGEFSEQGAGLKGCYYFVGGKVTLGGCLGTQISKLSGTGTGISYSTTSTAIIPSVLVGLAGEWSWNEHWGLGVFTDLQGIMWRPIYAIGSLGTVHQPAIVGMQTHLVVRATF